MSGFGRPPWWAVLLTVVGALLFVYLGVWQLHRADYKEDLLRRYAAAAAAPIQDFSQIAGSPPEQAFPRVRVEGHYRADRMYLLDNPKHDRRGGTEVFVPFVVNGHDSLLLVDLGFLPDNGHRTPAQPPALPVGQITLHGLYVPPPPVGFEMGGNALARQTKWPKSAIFLDPDQVAADLHHSLYPRVLALDPDPAAVYERTRSLDVSSMPPARHRAYAFQWFTFALAAVVILLVVNRKAKPRKPRT